MYSRGIQLKAIRGRFCVKSARKFSFQYTSPSMASCEIVVGTSPNASKGNSQYPTAGGSALPNDTSGSWSSSINSSPSPVVHQFRQFASSVAMNPLVLAQEQIGKVSDSDKAATMNLSSKNPCLERTMPNPFSTSHQSHTAASGSVLSIWTKRRSSLAEEVGCYWYRVVKAQDGRSVPTCGDHIDRGPFRADEEIQTSEIGHSVPE